MRRPRFSRIPESAAGPGGRRPGGASCGLLGGLPRARRSFLGAGAVYSVEKSGAQPYAAAGPPQEGVTMERQKGNPQKRNYQRELDKVIESLEREGRKPRLLLHSCCAPCSSYVLEYLSRYFAITLFYFNPNIYPPEEYRERIGEQERLIREMECAGALGIPVEFCSGRYEPEEFYQAVKGHEKDQEGGERCFICYELRLRRAAEAAKAGNFDYFTTTLSISPLKNAGKLNDIGERLAAEYGVPYLLSDFKKKNGYKRSTELSALYGLYRQDYCGCVFSREARRAAAEDCKAEKAGPADCEKVDREVAD